MHHIHHLSNHFCSAYRSAYNTAWSESIRTVLCKPTTVNHAYNTNSYPILRLPTVAFPTAV